MENLLVTKKNIDIEEIKLTTVTRVQAKSYSNI
jgi:hypothetical protein